MLVCGFVVCSTCIIDTCKLLSGSFCENAGGLVVVVVVVTHFYYVSIRGVVEPAERIARQCFFIIINDHELSSERKAPRLPQCYIIVNRLQVCAVYKYFFVVHRSYLGVFCLSLVWSKCCFPFFSASRFMT